MPQCRYIREDYKYKGISDKAASSGEVKSDITISLI